MFGKKKHYYGHILKKYDSSQKNIALKSVFLLDYNSYTTKDFLSLKEIYESNKLDIVLKKIHELKYNKNKISIPFLESLFHLKYNLELLPYDLKIKNLLDSIYHKINQNYKIKEFAILEKSNDTFDVNLLFMITYNKKGKLNFELIYQDSSIENTKNLKIFLDDILETNTNYFLKNFNDVNLYQDYMIKSLLYKNRKDPTFYFVNKLNYDFESPYFRQIHQNDFYSEKNSNNSSEFNFDEFDEFFDSEFDAFLGDDGFEENTEKLSKSSCYEIFGITPEATIIDIKRAYRAKVRMYHPDINKSEDSEKKFKEINRAYRILMGKDSINN